MQLPTELVGYILQFLTIEDRLKVLDSSMLLLHCFGVPESTCFVNVLNCCENNNYVNVLQYFLRTNQHFSYDILAIAARKGHMYLVNQVISLNVLAISDSEKVLGFAAWNGHLAVVERLLQIPGVDVTANGNCALGIAAKNGHLAVVERLLQEREVDTSHYNYAIQSAAANGHLAVVERLLQIPGVDASSNYNFAIQHAAENGHLAVVERLLQIPGVDASSNYNYAIQHAAEYGHSSVVERLMKVPGVNFPVVELLKIPTLTTLPSCVIDI